MKTNMCLGCYYTFEVVDSRQTSRNAVHPILLVPMSWLILYRWVKLSLVGGSIGFSGLRHSRRASVVPLSGQGAIKQMSDTWAYLRHLGAAELADCVAELADVEQVGNIFGAAEFWGGLSGLSPPRFRRKDFAVITKLIDWKSIYKARLGIEQMAEELQGAVTFFFNGIMQPALWKIHPATRNRTRGPSDYCLEISTVRCSAN